VWVAHRVREDAILGQELRISQHEVSAATTIAYITIIHVVSLRMVVATIAATRFIAIADPVLLHCLSLLS
jgi:hypothetical protein